MSLIFTKTYSGTIKREISEGQFSPSPLPEYYVKQEKIREVRDNNIDTLFPSKIFNVVTKAKSVEITTNTLNISITDIIIDGKAYIKKLNKVPTNFDKLDDYVIKDGVCYLNTDSTYIQIGTEFYTVSPVVGLEPFNRTPNVNVRRLKDCFKITFKTITPNLVHLELNSDSIFSPKLVDSWLIYYDCIYRITKPTYSYLSSHTFEYYDKEEIHEISDSIKLRDIPVSDITVQPLDRFVKIVYKTYRTNLMVNTKLGNAIYIGIEEESNASLEIKPTYESLINYFITSIHNKDTKFLSIKENPYRSTKAFNGRGESIFFVWETTSKYARSHNVPIGCERVVLSFSKLFNQQKKTISTPNYDLFSSTSFTDNEDYTTIPYLGTNASSLNQLLTTLNSLI